MKRLLFLQVLLFGLNYVNAQSYKPLDLHDIVRYRFYPKMVWGLNSMNDGEHYTVFNYAGTIDEYLYKTGEKTKTLVDWKAAGLTNISSEYKFSDDESKVLIYTNKKPIYRRSFLADFYVYNVDNKEVIQVSDSGQVRIASFSPDGQKVAFMRDNNLFYKDLSTGKVVQITFDGKKNKIINGAPDWVYEEEFSFSKAYQWSPDGKYLAYIKFDESKVKEYTLTFYAGEAPHYSKYELYPGLYKYKYPKAGEDNSVVSVHIYNILNGKTVNVDIGSDKDIYIPRIFWRPDGKFLAVERLNRAQNHIELLYAQPDNGNTKVVFSEKNKYYIGDEMYDNIRFLPDNEHILVMSERNGYRHLYLYDNEGNFISQLTDGKWDVTEFLGFNADKKLVFFQAAKESPLRREIYSVSIKNRKIKKLTPAEGTNEAEFSTTGKFFINTFSNVNTPYYVTLNDYKGRQIRVLVDNSDFKQKIDEYGGVNKKFFTFKNSQGVDLYGFMLFPPDFDSTKKYPAIIVQYSGPNSQTVLDSWSFGWNNYLAQHEFIIVGIEPRGTGARGEQFRKVTFHQLGKYETIDLVEGAKYIGNLRFIDKNRIGVWGWSYGGFMVLNCMTQGNGVFNTGVAVAPVTSWRYYDNIYTERYMGKPQDNPSGYDDNSPLNHVETFQGNLLLCFGTADDNVHPQNSFEFIERMVQANKQFEVFPFVNRNHSIYGGNTRYFLYYKMTKFFEDHLK